MNLGKIIMTKTIVNLIEENEEDKLINDNAVINGERILASYLTKKGKIWIVTEYDRSYTTILFPSEY